MSDHDAVPPLPPPSAPPPPPPPPPVLGVPGYGYPPGLAPDATWRPTDVRGRRIGGAFIDLAILTPVLLGLGERDGGSFRLEGWRVLLWLLVVLAYYGVSEVVAGTTLGKRLVDLRVAGPGGSTPTVGAVAVRTVMRIVDGFPFFYLVGFIVMLSTSEHQRVGDLVAKTHVVRTREAAPGGEVPARRRAALAAAVIAAVFVAGGIGLLVAGDADGDGAAGDGTELDGTVGRFDYRTEVLPFIDEVLAVFREPSEEGFARVSSSRTFLPGEFERAVSLIEDGPGRLQTVEAIRGISIVQDRTFPGVDVALDVAQVEVDGEFEHGDGTLVLFIADDDGLKLAGFNILSR